MRPGAQAAHAGALQHGYWRCGILPAHAMFTHVMHACCYSHWLLKWHCICSYMTTIALAAWN